MANEVNTLKSRNVTSIRGTIVQKERLSGGGSYARARVRVRFHATEIST